ncbi:Gfo/Idh/MocA family oxidoreductase [Micrococcus flavus]|nr:hypothetical protein GCM10007073_18650 [Micrococcus flavus]
MTPVAPPISTDPSVAVLIWGATHVHTQDHRDAVARHPRARLVAEVFDDGAADPAAQAAGIDWAGVDAVILDGRTEHHAAQLRAVPAGTPVFVEKPLGVDVAAAAEVAALLRGRPHSVGFFQHLLPATRRWAAQVRLAADLTAAAPERITLDFGHDGRVTGMFSGSHAWMVDPARGGSGNFLDLGLHLVHLARRLGLGRLDPVSCTLEPAVDGLSDAGGSAVLSDGRTEVRLSVTANRRREFTARAEWASGAGVPTWEVRGGTLFRDGHHVLTGQGPDAAIATTAFLDAVTGEPSELGTTDAAEALAVQELVAALLELA